MHYSGPCILRSPLQPEKYGLKLEVVLKRRYIYIETRQSVAVQREGGIPVGNKILHPYQNP